MEHSELARLLENIKPLFGGKLRTDRSQLQRIRAVSAMQRAAMRDLGDEGERVGNHELPEKTLWISRRNNYFCEAI